MRIAKLKTVEGKWQIREQDMRPAALLQGAKTLQKTICFAAGRKGSVHLLQKPRANVTLKSAL